MTTRKMAIPRGSKEYINAVITSDVTLSMAVAIAVTQKNSSTHTWLPAGWIGSAGTTRTAQTTDPVEFTAAAYPKTEYRVYAKLTDSPEVPIIDCGALNLT